MLVLAAAPLLLTGCVPENPVDPGAGEVAAGYGSRAQALPKPSTASAKPPPQRLPPVPRYRP